MHPVEPFVANFQFCNKSLNRRWKGKCANLGKKYAILGNMFFNKNGASLGKKCARLDKKCAGLGDIIVNKKRCEFGQFIF